GSKETRRFLQKAESFLGERLPDDAMPSDQGDSPMQIMKFKKWGSRRLAEPITRSVEWLAPAYLITNDERFGHEATRRALHVAQWGPNGFTGPKTSDFADIACLQTMAQAYDACFDLMTESERQAIRKAIAIRAARFFKISVNRKEARVFDAHFWQHMLREFTQVAIATAGEIPGAETWVRYVYELWLARFPALGGNDGAWANGNSYFGMNFVTCLDVPDIFNRLAGIDLFKHPWYEGASDFLIYTWPPGSLCDGFGDSTERRDKPTDMRIAFAQTLGEMKQNPYAIWYAKESQKEKSSELELDPTLAWCMLRTKQPQSKVRPKSPRNLPQASAFRDAGVVTMHTNITDTPNNLMVAFRSSPYGASSHMHAGQNEFNILYGGERLIRNTGYYIAASDPHCQEWYRTTRGHNSVLIDGKGQTRGGEGYGWIARYLHGRKISYCLGDASNAYGDAGMTHFRRHFILLRPGTIVIYDDLEADHPADWGWLIHSARRLTANSKLNRLRTNEKTARTQVNFLGSSQLKLEVDTKFDPPAINWSNRTFNGKRGCPDQWHATVSPAEPCHKMRYLAVLQVRASADKNDYDLPVRSQDGWLTVGDWEIHAEMETSKAAAIDVRNRDGSAVLAVDRLSAKLGSKRFRSRQGESILAERVGKKTVIERSQDELPEAAR
ncbi:MAG: DUF4962 domain-containing protein, partial [Candidatus Latescibacteria bacterium]|nr:DUF4962 domain-containing protein [Candidatus Latescibacterota bacterium]